MLKIVWSKLFAKILSKEENHCALKIARKCLNNSKLIKMSPQNISNHKMKRKKIKPFKQSKMNTETYNKSAIPYMRRLFNIYAVGSK